MKHKIFLLLISIPLIFSSCKSNDEDEKKSFVVSYISRAGTAPSPIFVEENTLLSTNHLPDLTAENYVFEGWEYEGKKLQAGSKRVTQNMILTALWKGNDCAVTFTHSSNVGGQSFTRIYENGEEITLPKNPYGQKAGLEFKGWLSSKVYYKENATFKVTGDTVFTAYYTEQGEHTISYYDVQDGILVTDPQKFADITTLTGQENPFTFTESQNIFISDIQKTGYSFEGFFTSKSCEPDEAAKTFWLASTVKNDVTLYAKWTTNSYSINFDGNAGTLKAGKTQDSIDNKSYEDSITLPECNYELPGYEFLAWSLKSEEYETEFEAGKTVSVEDLCSQADGDQITLYAHWKDAENPAAPTNFNVDTVDSTKVSLSWINSPSADLAYTRLSYYKKSSTIKRFVDFVAEDYLPNTKCSYTVEELEKGETYYFTITSYDVTGNTNGWTEDCNLIAVPRAKAYTPVLTFSQASPTQMIVKWDSPSPTDYPEIENIKFFVDGVEAGSYSATNGEGDCYTKNTFSYTVNPLSIYKVQLKLTEKVDAGGRNNPSETEEYTYFSEPDFNINIKTGTNIPEFYRYANALGFVIEEPVRNSSNELISSLGITCRNLLEITQLDSEGNKIERTKNISEFTTKNENGVYLKSGLESSSNYYVRVYIEVSKTINGKNYTSYAYSLADANALKKCSTTNSNQADIGYICYGASEFYYDAQPTDTKTVYGVVTSVNEFGQPTRIMAAKDLTNQVNNLSEGETELQSLSEGNLVWSIPSADDILEIFEPQNLDIIYNSFEKAKVKWFSHSTISNEGVLLGRYLTTTKDETGKSIVFDISQKEYQPIEVSTKSGNSTYSVRPFAKLQN